MQIPFDVLSRLPRTLTDDDAVHSHVTPDRAREAPHEIRTIAVERTSNRERAKETYIRLPTKNTFLTRRIRFLPSETSSPIHKISLDHGKFPACTGLGNDAERHALLRFSGFPGEPHHE